MERSLARGKESDSRIVKKKYGRCYVDSVWGRCRVVKTDGTGRAQVPKWFKVIERALYHDSTLPG